MNANSWIAARPINLKTGSFTRPPWVEARRVVAGERHRIHRRHPEDVAERCELIEQKLCEPFDLAALQKSPYHSAMIPGTGCGSGRISHGEKSDEDRMTWCRTINFSIKRLPTSPQLLGQERRQEGSDAFGTMNRRSYDQFLLRWEPSICSRITKYSVLETSLVSFGVRGHRLCEYDLGPQSKAPVGVG